MRNACRFRWFALGLSLLAVVGPAGCGPGGSEEELGTVVWELPEAPGADKPYPLPPLDADAKASKRDEAKSGSVSQPLVGPHEG